MKLISLFLCTLEYLSNDFLDEEFGSDDESDGWINVSHSEDEIEEEEEDDEETQQEKGLTLGGNSHRIGKVQHLGKIYQKGNAQLLKPLILCRENLSSGKSLSHGKSLTVERITHGKRLTLRKISYVRKLYMRESMTLQKSLLYVMMRFTPVKIYHQGNI